MGGQKVHFTWGAKFNKVGVEHASIRAPRYSGCFNDVVKGRCPKIDKWFNLCYNL